MYTQCIMGYDAITLASALKMNALGGTMTAKSNILIFRFDTKQLLFPVDNRHTTPLPVHLQTYTWFRSSFLTAGR